MEEVFGKAIAELVKLGGGYVLAAVMIMLYVRLWNIHQECLKDGAVRQDKLNDRLFVTSEAQTKALVEVGAVLGETVKTMESVDQTTRLLADRSKRHE